MRLRKLRIVWSALWGVVIVLLIALWARSYSGRSSYEILVTPAHRYYIHSLRGTVAIEKLQRIFVGIELSRLREDNDLSYLTTTTGIRISSSNDEVYAMSISYWLLTLAATVVATFPWLPWRFSLRTLLVATTLIAALLGSIVYLCQN
jgi:hypothetical protein